MSMKISILHFFVIYITPKENWNLLKSLFFNFLKTFKKNLTSFLTMHLIPFYYNNYE
jgi:hypothetical protein